jgi:hypothetical protein
MATTKSLADDNVSAYTSNKLHTFLELSTKNWAVAKLAQSNRN